MFRKISSLSSLVVMLAALFLFTTSTSVFAEKRGANLRQSVEYSHRCDVPYNIEIFDYNTGLHIVADWMDNVTFTFDFYCGGSSYATTTVVIGPEGWTGLVSDLLPPGYSLRFPTLLIAYSHEDPSDDSEEIWFWITQFLFTGSGFSHQTFTSYSEGGVLY